MSRFTVSCLVGYTLLLPMQWLMILFGRQEWVLWTQLALSIPAFVAFMCAVTAPPIDCSQHVSQSETNGRIAIVVLALVMLYQLLCIARMSY